MDQTGWKNKIAKQNLLQKGTSKDLQNSPKAGLNKKALLNIKKSIEQVGRTNELGTILAVEKQFLKDEKVFYSNDRVME